jgi:PAS domain S-box-containing protein
MSGGRLENEGRGGRPGHRPAGGSGALGRAPRSDAWEDRLMRLLAPERLWRMPPGLRYALAVLMAAAATVLRQALLPWLGTDTAYGLALAATVASTLIFGLGPGLTTMALSDIGVEVFVLKAAPPWPGLMSLSRLGLAAAVGIALAFVLHGIRAAQLKARRSEARLAAFGAATFEGVVESEKGLILDCNEQFARMAGRAPSELKGTPIADLIAPEDRERVAQNIAGNSDSVIVHGMIGPNGTRLVVEAHGRPVVPGSLRRFTAVRDITAGRRAEKEMMRANAELAGYAAEIQAANAALVESRRAALNIMEDALLARDTLRESEERLKRAQEMAHLGSWELGIPDNTLKWSEEVYRIFGMVPGSFGATYEAFLNAVHPDDRAAVDEAYARSLRDGQDQYDIEHRIVRPDNGEVRTVREKCVHIRDESGRIVRSVGMVHDITDQKRTEELRQALAEQERLRLGAAVEQASDAVIMVDLDGTIRYVNATFEAINRVTRSQAVGRAYFDLLAGDPAAELVAGSVRAGRAWHGRITRRVDGGRTVELEVAISTVKNPKGTVIGGLITEKDVTQENALQRALRRGQKMEALGTLAGGITHDFNNILGAIIINTELALLDLDLSHPSRSVLPNVLQAANRGKELVKQIIAFSRQQEWNRKITEVAPVVKDALKFLRSTFPKDIAVRDAIAPGSGAVLGDASQLNQVIVNLCQNAALAMPDGGGRLDVRLEPVEVSAADASRNPDLTAGPYVRLTVADTGCGMSPEVMERIFEPFFTTRGPGGGTGLGLAVVHGIVKSAGGGVTVESEPGKGSVFQVYLPRLEGVTSEAENAEPPRPAGGSERILLVEDETAQRESLARSLKKLGYAVTAKASGRAALAAFREDPAAFDIVITDQTMPKMTGLEMAAAMVKARPGLPVILCTGFSEKIEGASAAREIVRQYVMKPFTLEEITRLIRTVVEKSSAETSPPGRG